MDWMSTIPVMPTTNPARYIAPTILAVVLYVFICPPCSACLKICFLPGHGDGDLASGVPASHMADRLGGFAQRIGAVDDRRDLAGLDQLLEGEQVLEPRRHDKRP